MVVVEVAVVKVVVLVNEVSQLRKVVSVVAGQKSGAVQRQHSQSWYSGQRQQDGSANKLQWTRPAVLAAGCWPLKIARLAAHPGIFSPTGRPAEVFWSSRKFVRHA